MAPCKLSVDGVFLLILSGFGSGNSSWDRLGCLTVVG